MFHLAALLLFLSGSADGARLAGGDPHGKTPTGRCWKATEDDKPNPCLDLEQEDCEKGFHQTCMWVPRGVIVAAAHEAWRIQTGSCYSNAKDSGLCKGFSKDACDAVEKANNTCYWEENYHALDHWANTLGTCLKAAESPVADGCGKMKNQEACEMEMEEDVCMWVDQGVLPEKAHNRWRDLNGKCRNKKPMGSCHRIHERKGCEEADTMGYNCSWELNENTYDAASALEISGSKQPFEPGLQLTSRGICMKAMDGEGSDACAQLEEQDDCEIGWGEVCMWVHSGTTPAFAHKVWQEKSGKCVNEVVGGACHRVRTRVACENAAETYQCHWENNTETFNMEENTRGICFKAADGEGSEQCSDHKNQEDCEFGWGEVCMWIDEGISPSVAHDAWRVKFGSCMNGIKGGPCHRVRNKEDCDEASLRPEYKCFWKNNEAPKLSNAAKRAALQAARKAQEERYRRAAPSVM
eukprot:TRINITY_DN64816_c0_g1_i1.p1 TRINITY_DN64816_c0_g1~~TRINITY_DN64816_c0_g1_i1.p1  ORF type:complete len:467 (-),score=95.38 TRINITY_DN64816_c0_g1_i1:176-1576(-)